MRSLDGYEFVVNDEWQGLECQWLTARTVEISPAGYELLMALPSLVQTFADGLARLAQTRGLFTATLRVT
jgi:hypothetical protein